MLNLEVNQRTVTTNGITPGVSRYDGTEKALPAVNNFAILFTTVTTYFTVERSRVGAGDKHLIENDFE